MNFLTTSFVFWAVFAVTVFWALGAYNRLVKLRVDMVRALQLLAVQWQSNAQAIRQELATLSHAQETDSTWASLGDDADSWRPLALATKQFQACIAGVLAKPHTAPPVDDIASIRAAHEVMLGAWQRLCGTHEDLAGAAVPQRLALLWQRQNLLAQEKLRDYNACVQAYNHSVAQFPAVLLAWIFAFGPAQAM
jgi:LemA protein